MPSQCRLNENTRKPRGAATRAQRAIQTGCRSHNRCACCTGHLSAFLMMCFSQCPKFEGARFKILAYSYAMKGMCLPLLPLLCYLPCRIILQIKQILSSTIKRQKKEKKKGGGGREEKDKCILLAWRLLCHTFNHQLKESMISSVKPALKMQKHVKC